jgi:hypothetical protein
MSGWIDPLGVRALYRFIQAEQYRLGELIEEQGRLRPAGRRVARYRARYAELGRLQALLQRIERPGLELRPLPNSGGIALGYNSAGPNNFSYPNGPDGGLYLSPIWIHHSGSIRGYLKGLWAPCHDRPLNHNDTFSGTGNMAGKSFLVQDIPAWVQNVSQVGQVHIETSNTWS